jgi:hypothetical protein
MYLSEWTMKVSSWIYGVPRTGRHHILFCEGQKSRKLTLVIKYEISLWIITTKTSVLRKLTDLMRDRRATLGGVNKAPNMRVLQAAILICPLTHTWPPPVELPNLMCFSDCSCLILALYLSLLQFHTYLKKLVLLSHFPLPLIPTPKQDLYISFIHFFNIWTSHMRENMQYFSFSVWLISLNLRISSSIHFLAKRHNFILLYNWVILHCVYHIFFIHSSVDGHIGLFYIWAIMNSAPINMCV